MRDAGYARAYAGYDVDVNVCEPGAYKAHGVRGEKSRRREADDGCAQGMHERGGGRTSYKAETQRRRCRDASKTQRA